MSYENPDRRVYTFPLYDYGAGSSRLDYVVGPKGKKGRLIDYGVIGVQEDFAGTTPATVAVGTTANPDAYGEEMSLASATIAGGGLTLQSQYDRIADAASFAALLVDEDLPADTPVLLTSTSAVTGPTGQGCPYMVIDWDR